MKKLLTIIFLLTIATALQAQNRGLQGKRGQQTYKTTSECGVPQGIFVDEITANSVTIHWMTNGAAFYQIHYYNTRNPQEKGTLMTNLGSVAIDNLQPCATYKFVIIAKCPDGLAKSRNQVFFTQGCK
jgi:hypothetical protein